MSKQVIPQQTIVVCDLCGATCSPMNCLLEGKLTIAGNVLDVHNMPVAGDSIVLDLCDRCLKRTKEAMSKLQRQITEERVSAMEG